MTVICGYVHVLASDAVESHRTLADRAEIIKRHAQGDPQRAWPSPNGGDTTDTQTGKGR